MKGIKLMNEGGIGSMPALSWRFVRYKGNACNAGNAHNDGYGHIYGNS
ncbi:MAG TPA: hypothetical protein GXX75_13515 [Clostridiales bacterium]|nr:hypothetical protein [Clostridiales bacterium]